MTCTSVNAPFLEKKFKKSFLIPCRVRCRGSVNQSYVKGFWAENRLGEGLGNSELSFFSSLHFPYRYANCPAIKMQRNTFSFFFFFIKKKILNVALFIFPIQTLRPVLQRSCGGPATREKKRKIVLSAKQTPRSDLSMTICTCRMEAWSNTFCPALSHCCFQSHLHVCFQPGRTHTFHVTDTKMNTSNCCSSCKTSQHKDFHFTACP